jgi:hypothetical protein
VQSIVTPWQGVKDPVVISGGRSGLGAGVDLYEKCKGRSGEYVDALSNAYLASGLAKIKVKGECLEKLSPVYRLMHVGRCEGELPIC